MSLNMLPYVLVFIFLNVEIDIENLLKRVWSTFYQNVNIFMLGPHVLGPQREHFALPIPKCWYLKILVDPM